jgi:carboxypeptidase T
VVRSGRRVPSGSHTRRRIVGAAAAALLASSVSAGALAQPSRPVDGAPYAGQLLVTAQPRTAAEVERLWALADNVLAPHDPAVTAHTLVVTRATLERMRAAGLAVSAQPIDVQEIVDRAAVRRPAATVAPGRLGIFGAALASVPDLDGVYRRLEELEQASGGGARVITIGTSVEGRPLRALRIAPAGPAAATILVTGTQHAREWASTMVALGIADALVGQAPRDPSVEHLVSHLEVVVVPVVNVDGYVATHAGRRLLRKNLDPRCGVDLNRNWDVAFGAGASSPACHAENYPGPGAFSEPETRAVRDLAASFEGRLRLYLDYHAPAEQVMIPLAYTRSRLPDYDKSRAWAELYAATVRTLYDTWHPARDAYDLAQGQGGGAIDWFRLGWCQSFAVELRDGRELGGFQLPDDQIVPSLEENWLAFQRLALEVAREGGAPFSAVVFGRREPAASEAPSLSRGCAYGGGGAPAGLAALPLLALVVWRRRRYRARVAISAAERVRR